jgi:hypothetical protein
MVFLKRQARFLGARGEISYFPLPTGVAILFVSCYKIGISKDLLVRASEALRTENPSGHSPP